MKQIRKRLTYANVMSSLAVFLMIGGGAAFAALGKNTVGTKQLKKKAVTAAKIRNNAVTKAKIKKNSVTGGKVKNNSLTGADIKLSKLGTVPSAKHASSADTATTATTAGTASALTPIEATHLVGAPGEPPFEGGSNNAPGEAGINFQPVGFYKDHQGIVHLDGIALAGEPGTFGTIFTLPPGFRPASGKIQAFAGIGGGAEIVFGSNVVVEGMNLSGKVVGEEGELVALSGITFKAEG